ncbi:MAG: hypothetical protein K6E75_10670 [Lachnospiraceae bacterium]|nr:hypothetical protein [Lachnospiraceae bacterium]
MGPSTEYIKDEITSCDNIEDLTQALKELVPGRQKLWKDEINRILDESGLGKSGFAKACDVSRPALDKWCNLGGLPRTREQYIRIGMVAGFGVDEMNHFLQRFGGYSALYPKALVDCICIYVLTHHEKDEWVQKYDEIWNRLKNEITGDFVQGSAGQIDTVLFEEKIGEVSDEEKLELFVRQNADIFKGAYSKLNSYIKVYIEFNYLENTYGVDTVQDVAETQGWTPGLLQCVSLIRQNKWYPARDKLISLGIHLGMNEEEINHMFELAKMEPLCAKNLYESVILYILADADLSDVFDKDADGYSPDTLYYHACDILEQIRIPELESYMKEYLNAYNDEEG